ALQPKLARVAERHVAGALRQLLERRRDEDLAAARLRRDPRGQDDVAAAEVVTLADRLAGVQPLPNPDRLGGAGVDPRGERALDGDRALDAVARARERDHEAVALRYHHKAAVHPHLVAHDLVVLAQELEEG